MYFYYFLGWELEARDDLSRAQKDARAENTYCLALGKHYSCCKSLSLRTMIGVNMYSIQHLSFL